MSSKPAKAEAAKPEAEGAAAPARNRSKRMMIMIIGAVLALALIGGGAYVVMAKKKAAAAAAASAEGDEDSTEAPAKKSGEHGKPPVFMQLENFIVNLQQESGEQYLQVVMSFKLSTNEQAEEVKQYMPEIRHQILMLLSSKKASEISTTEGREALANEIKDKANATLGYEETPKKKKKGKKEGGEEGGPPVQAVLFTSFVIQVQ